MLTAGFAAGGGTVDTAGFPRSTLEVFSIFGCLTQRRDSGITDVSRRATRRMAESEAYVCHSSAWVAHAKPPRQAPRAGGHQGMGYSGGPCLGYSTSRIDAYAPVTIL